MFKIKYNSLTCPHWEFRRYEGAFEYDRKHGAGREGEERTVVHYVQGCRRKERDEYSLDPKSKVRYTIMDSDLLLFSPHCWNRVGIMFQGVHVTELEVDTPSSCGHRICQICHNTFDINDYLSSALTST